MTVRDEFLQILRVLVETPQPTDKKPPSTEKEQTPEAVSDTSDEQSDDKCRRAS
jgi:hypothetical protein